MISSFIDASLELADLDRMQQNAAGTEKGGKRRTSKLRAGEVGDS